MQLGQILLRKQLISSEQLEEVVQLQVFQKNRIGELLLQKGLILNTHLEAALKEQYWRKNGFWIID